MMGIGSEFGLRADPEEVGLQQNPLGTGRVPQVRQSVPGPKMRCFDCFYLPGLNLLMNIVKALVGFAPFLSPGTLWRTWGTRPGGKAWWQTGTAVDEMTP